MIVKVTKNHIHKGQKGKPCDCPIALALRMAGHQNVEVFNSCIWINGKRYPTQLKVDRWIRRYDKGETVEPLEFEL